MSKFSLYDAVANAGEVGLQVPREESGGDIVQFFHLFFPFRNLIPLTFQLLWSNLPTSCIAHGAKSIA